ncbi:uncharacterized protein LOC133920159 [Phragmites australis]|uniref:uncharacterized protein LOC133920159 n=1 Tax=Phragmites australis TaxID=29695 RepID=UPI002D785E91|nr:uncharacterized protein LOC133920159 [Phragmites australis]
MPTKNMNGKLPDEAELLTSLLAAARPFLRGELAKVDPELPSLVSVLCSAGAGECYHKHGTFLAHLVDVYRILRLWGAPDAVARCGLFHSSYSNSYVNLAIFHPDTGRDHVRAIVGAPAERLVHLFCVVPRHALIHDDLHLHYTDAELRDHLAASQASLDAAKRPAKAMAASVDAEPWRRKLRSLVPPEGVVVKHIRTGEPVALSRRVVAVFILMTVADFSDQYTDYQDKLFENEDGRLEFRGDNWGALWPGTGKPGLWVSAMSRLAALYNLIARDEQLDKLLLESAGSNKEGEGEGDDMVVGELVIPPVFEGCTQVLDPEEQKAARDLYWEAICSGSTQGGVEALLRESIGKNPFVGEPQLVLAQVLLNTGRYEEAAAAAERGVRLLLEWGSSWDKRMSWEGWVSWGRVMRDKAKQRQWPRTAWGVINLGLVQGVHNCNSTEAHHPSTV